MTSTTPKAAKARKTPAEGAPALTIVAPAEPVVAGPVLKKKDLIERAAERSDLKRGEARKGVEAALDVLAEALLSGARTGGAAAGQDQGGQGQGGGQCPDPDGQDPGPQ